MSLISWTTASSRLAMSRRLCPNQQFSASWKIWISRGARWLVLLALRLVLLLERLPALRVPGRWDGVLFFFVGLVIHGLSFDFPSYTAGAHTLDQVVTAYALLH